jgi:leucyl aminopeptidase
MRIHYKREKIDGVVREATVIFFAGEAEESQVDLWLEPFRPLWEPHVKSGAFKPEIAGILPLFLEGRQNGTGESCGAWLVLVGLPKKDQRELLGAAARATESLGKLGAKKASFVVPGFSRNPLEAMELMALGVTLAAAERLAYKSLPGNTHQALEEVTFLGNLEAPGEDEALEAIHWSLAVAKAQLRARDLTDRPANLLYPGLMAKEALRLAGEFGLQAYVWDEERLAKEGAGGILAVGSGSSHPPRMVVLEYEGLGANRDTGPTALVGKGVTFDSGGLCIKPPENMSRMKTDMAGAATVLATILAAAELSLPVRLVAVMPLAENLPSGSAFRPGDIVTTLSGQTVEIMNTDAEGRLILCDALT